MEPESPSPYPQVPATCPYPEPTPSSLHENNIYTYTYSFFILCIIFYVDRMQTQLRPSCRTTHKFDQVSCVMFILFFPAYWRHKRKQVSSDSDYVCRECLLADMAG